MKHNNVADAYQWFLDHPKLLYDDFTQPWIDLWPVLVNPETKEIDDDESKNTMVNWWIECGPYEDCIIPFTDKPELLGTHDIDLDCGGDTVEEAIYNLVKLIEEKYGDY